MVNYANNNAMVIKTIKGTRSLAKDSLDLPKPSSNQAVVRISHAAQNSMDGTLNSYIVFRIIGLIWD